MSHPAHPWMPASPCDDSCLPAAGTTPAVGRVRQLLRIGAAAAIVLVGAVLAVSLPLLRPDGREGALRAWFRALLGALQIRLEIIGDTRFGPRGAGVLVVSNHMSWLDLVALSAVQPLRMVAKKEVRDWPLIGLLSRRAGAIFIDRERLSTLPDTVTAVSDVLAGGAAVGAFPEGTTWCGMVGGRFRPALFQAAADTATPVRPVALRYRLAGPGSTGTSTPGAMKTGATTTRGPTTTVAAFVGSATLWRALVLVAGVRDLLIEMQLLPLLDAADADRRALAARAGAAVATALLPEPVPWSASARAAPAQAAFRAAALPVTAASRTP